MNVKFIYNDPSDAMCGSGNCLPDRPACFDSGKCMVRQLVEGARSLTSLTLVGHGRQHLVLQASANCGAGCTQRAAQQPGTGSPGPTSSSSHGAPPSPAPPKARHDESRTRPGWRAYAPATTPRPQAVVCSCPVTSGSRRRRSRVPAGHRKPARAEEQPPPRVRTPTGGQVQESLAAGCRRGVVPQRAPRQVSRPVSWASRTWSAVSLCCLWRLRVLLRKTPSRMRCRRP